MQYAITKEEINQKPLEEYSGPLWLVRRQEEIADAVAEIGKETLLGFDTETRPAFRKGESYLPSLLQLGGEGKVWIFQIQLLDDLAPIFEVLANPKVTKAGVAVSRDVDELRQLYPFKPAGFQDLGHMAAKRGFQNTGLRPLAALLLNLRVSKSARVTNWADPNLSEKQITYAATDAWVSRRLYQALQPLPLAD